MTEPLAHLRLTFRDGVPVAHLAGELDLSNAEGIGEQAAAGLDRQPLGFVLDLSEVRYLDSAGLQMLFDLGRRLGQQRVALWVVSPTIPAVRRILELVELETAFPTVDDVDQALAEIRVAAADQRASHAQQALDRRVVVEQAKDLLVERLGVSASAAFEALRSQARREARPLREVAEAVVNGDADAATPG